MKEGKEEWDEPRQGDLHWYEKNDSAGGLCYGEIKSSVQERQKSDGGTLAWWGHVGFWVN
jgi:hypothetical protein